MPSLLTGSIVRGARHYKGTSPCCLYELARGSAGRAVMLPGGTDIAGLDGAGQVQEIRSVRFVESLSNLSISRTTERGLVRGI